MRRKFFYYNNFGNSSCLPCGEEKVQINFTTFVGARWFDILVKISSYLIRQWLNEKTKNAREEFLKSFPIFPLTLKIYKKNFHRNSLIRIICQWLMVLDQKCHSLVDIEDWFLSKNIFREFLKFLLALLHTRVYRSRNPWVFLHSHLCFTVGCRCVVWMKIFFLLLLSS